MRRFLRENSLSVFFFAIFAVTLLGQSLAGQRAFNEEQLAHDEPTISWARYLVSSDFGGAVMENWQSEFLQLFTMVVLTAFLVHRGSMESKDSDDEMMLQLTVIRRELAELKAAGDGRRTRKSS